MANKHHILIVEDDQIIRTAYETKFRMSGYETVSVSDGESAIKEVETNKPDLVLLDVLLPGISGLDALKRMKEIHPDIKVFIFSNMWTDEVIKRATDLGALKYFTKATFTPNQICEEIEKVLAAPTDSTPATNV